MVVVTRGETRNERRKTTHSPPRLLFPRGYFLHVRSDCILSIEVKSIAKLMRLLSVEK